MHLRTSVHPVNVLEDSRSVSPAQAMASVQLYWTPYEPTNAVLDQLRMIAPGWDRQGLIAQYQECSKGKAAPENPHGGFIGWTKRLTKKRAARLIAGRPALCICVNRTS
jgi:hypothetical protein